MVLTGPCSSCFEPFPRLLQAFVLPMMRHIKDQPPLQQGDGPIGLLMAPTRELVQQISKVRSPKIAHLTDVQLVHSQ